MFIKTIKFYNEIGEVVEEFTKQIEAETYEEFFGKVDQYVKECEQKDSTIDFYQLY
jgi:hypothetical protein